MFFAVDNDCGNLLIHEYQNGGQESWKNGHNRCPPRVTSKRRNYPSSSWPSGSQFPGDLQLGGVHPDVHVHHGHGQDGDEHGEVGHEVPDASGEEVAELELFEVPWNEEGADEE